MPKISIAMATYCGENYVKKQLESLLNQTRRPDEVLIFDDRSRDNTVQIVKDFIKENNLTNWSITVNETNLGFIKNFHTALKACSGDIIFMCDQDDIWHSNKLETMEKLFEEYPDAMAINTSFQFIDGEDKPIESVSKAGTSNHSLIPFVLEDKSMSVISKTQILYNISPGCTMAVRKELKDYYLENATLRVPHDHEMNIYATLMGNLYFYNAELISYRIHTANVIGLATKKKNLLKFLSMDFKKYIKTVNESEGNVAALCAEIFKNTEDKDIFLRYAEFYSYRKALLVDKKLSGWFKILFNYSRLKPFTELKKSVADLYCFFCSVICGKH